MSKLIQMTDEIREQIKQEFMEELEKAKASDGKFSFSKTLNSTDRKATVVFTETAYIKMELLIQNFDKEVAWHGVAVRGNDREYWITDILVYPQEVSGTTVNTDQATYETWLMEQPDDVFNNIRMQGHSHVNMGVTPSTVDLEHQSKILEQLEGDMFYIFMIWNKHGDKNVRIYDLKENTLFEPGDVTVEIQDDGSGFMAFIDDAKESVKYKVYYCPAPQYSGYGQGSVWPQNQSPVYGSGTGTKPAASSSDDTKKGSKKDKKGGKKKAKFDGKSLHVFDGEDDPYGTVSQR